MPGINSKNYRCINLITIRNNINFIHKFNNRLLMNKVKDLQELVTLGKAELSNILENDTSAELLWNFLHSEMQIYSNSKKF